MKANSITPRQAERILEDLRKGIPPSGYLEYFTVGRKDQIEWLNSHLNGEGGYALLLKANYGSGKSHLMQLIREKALANGFATSLVVLDANSGVRFNRMDQILGAILRNLKIDSKEHGPLDLEGILDMLGEAAMRAKNDRPYTPSHKFWSKVTTNWTWTYSEELSSPPLYIAFRAWVMGNSREARELALDWLSFPENYKGSHYKSFAPILPKTLVDGLRHRFRDPRQEWQFREDDAFLFHPSDYRNCWHALEDLRRMLMNSGVQDFVILFDEFEDVLTNLKNINWKEKAFWNLFRFVSGDRFTGKTFYAVTPSFAQKCKGLLIEKDRWDFDYSQFDELETFEMSPLGKRNLLDLAERIAAVHERAYSYEVDPDTRERMTEAVAEAANSAVQDRARQAIKLAVAVLDDDLE